MILNTPTSEDFYKTGKELLSFAWDIVAKLLVNLNEAEQYGIDPSEVSEEYWNLSQRHLTTALTITQQGVEFVIKGRICAISPYILISDSPSKWPSPYSGPLDFSTFRTIDAQDLIKIHDTFSDAPFEGGFVDAFNNLREKRNTIMHSVSKSLEITFNDILSSLLFMHKTLFPNDSWARLRFEALTNSPSTELGNSDFITNEACMELFYIIEALKPAQVKEYFKIDKKKRAYYCPHCHDEASHDYGDIEPKLARLSTPEAGCNTLYCPVCDDEYEVERTDCTKEYDADCPGNVISNYGTCMTCGH